MYFYPTEAAYFYRKNLTICNIIFFLARKQALYFINRHPTTDGNRRCLIEPWILRKTLLFLLNIIPFNSICKKYSVTILLNLSQMYIFSIHLLRYIPKNESRHRRNKATNSQNLFVFQDLLQQSFPYGKTCHNRRLMSIS